MFPRILAAGQQTRQAAQSMAERVCNAVACFDIDPQRPQDSLDELLREAAESQADLLVVSASNRVVARRAAMLSPSSVLMVPDSSAVSFSRVLVPVDFSPSSAQALRKAWQLAVDGSLVTALAVEADEEPWLDWPQDRGAVERELADFLERTVPGSGITGKVTPVSPSATTLHGDGLLPTQRIEGADVASAILRAAAEMGATLIVMGTRGRTRSATLLLGSVTEHVMQDAKCPVLAIKTGHAPMSLGEAIIDRLLHSAPSPVAS